MDKQFEEAIARCKTPRQKEELIALQKCLEEFEKTGDEQAFCRMHGHHGSWILIRGGGWLCASCSNVFQDKEQADKELMQTERAELDQGR